MARFSVVTLRYDHFTQNVVSEKDGWMDRWIDGWLLVGKLCKFDYACIIGCGLNMFPHLPGEGC